MSAPQHEEGYADERDVEQLKADLFGIDDDDDADQLEDDVGMGSVEEDAEPAAGKRKRVQVDDDEEEGGFGSEPKRGKSAAADGQEEEEEEGALEDEEEQPGDAAQQPAGDEEDAPTAEDEGFIDDTGVEHEEQVDEEDYEDMGPPPEAEEVAEGEEDELEGVLKGKRRQRAKEDAAAIEREMYTFLAHMDLAAEEDMAAHKERKPALSKIRMLRKVEDTLAKLTYHEEFLRQGGLGSLKAWLTYYDDGTLPHLRVRTTVLRILDKLPINTAFEEHKQWLGKSMVGQLVMFYMKCRDEVPENQRLAKSLVEKWSKPIFETAAAERKMLAAGSEEERLEARKMRKQVEQQIEAEKQVDHERTRVAKKGEPGFRWHASIPQPAKLDYVRQPESLAAAPEQESRGGGKKESTRFDRKIREISRKKNAGTLKAQSVSVQGRGLYM